MTRKPYERYPGNRFLDSISDQSYTLLSPHMVSQAMKLKSVLFAEYERPSFAYFPLDGVASVVALAKAGESAEVGFIGCEGIVGAYHLLGPAKVPTRCFVQIEGDFLRIPFTELLSAYGSTPEIRTRVHEFIQADSLSVSQMAGCNQMHDHGTRLARWLLMAMDRHGSETLAVTHEILAEMIGARRTTVTVIVGSLQRRGLIRCERRRLSILDRKGLENAACDCYGIARNLFDGLYQN